jgi:uncharacterized glyoxalase superfamily protein PhnB
MAMDQRITPMLSYEDGAAAIDWLCRAFGFEEVEGSRMTDDDGTVRHAELRLEGASIFLATPTDAYEAPRHHAQHCEQTQEWRRLPYVIDGLHVLVEDVDGHFTRAKDAGAAILSEPEDEPYGERIYRAEDPEGHRWMFAQKIA